MTGQAVTTEDFTDRFDRNRAHLRAVAYRMLGSADEADDAVQETWLRAARSDAAAVANLTGWLTTVISRICLDMLKARRRRREDLGDPLDDHGDPAGEAADPEAEAMLADSVGAALLVVLDALGPDERVAFVLHDLFTVPFGEIAETLGRSTAAAKKLASRARARVHGAPLGRPADAARHREVVDAFLAASRAGDIDGLLAVLAPDVVRRDGRSELRGVRRVAAETRTNAARARFAVPILVDGGPGIVVAPRGRLQVVLALEIDSGGGGDRIAEITVIDDPAALRRLTLAVP